MRFPHRRPSRSAWRWSAIAIVLAFVAAGAEPKRRAAEAGPAPAVEARAPRPAAAPGRPDASGSAGATGEAAPAGAAERAARGALAIDADQAVKSAQTLALFAVVSLAPAAVLMLTAFVRINIVLLLLRQALGSPQVPGNQVVTVLALMLTALVMRPVFDAAYERGVKPYNEGRSTPAQAWEATSKPVKAFMLDQIERTRHDDYVWRLHEYAAPADPDPDADPDRAEPAYAEGGPLRVAADHVPFRVVAPAYLLSELTTALVIGFYIYLPFLVVDLVVSAVLAAMGLFMLPPALVSLPLKLVLFVLADGWMLVATMLLDSFAGP